MNKHLLIISLVAAVIGISAIGFWIVSTLPTPEERDAAHKDSDISEFMTDINKIRYVVVDIDTGKHIERLLKSPSDMEIVSLKTALQNAKWEYKQVPKESAMALAEEEYFELIYEEGENRKFTVVADEYWLVIYQSQDSYVVIKGESLKEFLSIITSQANSESSD